MLLRESAEERLNKEKEWMLQKEECKGRIRTEVKRTNENEYFMDSLKSKAKEFEKKWKNTNRGKMRDHYEKH